ncbi:hypothetical protein J2X61_001311 [Bacillus sp. 3255]|nr:hypothetical protein [Bacillus sp. 3255]
MNILMLMILLHPPIVVMLQINVYNTLVKQLEEASEALVQLDAQIKLVEIMNNIEDEFTKLSAITEH